MSLSVTPSRLPTARAIRTTPQAPATNIRPITTMPIQWMRSFGMNSNSASRGASIPPSSAWDIMNPAKNSATTTAITVPITGLVYSTRASPVGS